MIDNIDLTKSNEYTLSIRLSADGFCFSIVNPIKESDFYFSRYEVLRSCSMSANLRKWLAETKELRLSYRKVNVIVDSTRFIATPSDFFDKDKVSLLFYSNFSESSNETVLYDDAVKGSMKVLFGIDKYTLQSITEQYSNAQIYSSVTPLLNYFESKSRMGSNKKIYVQLSEHDMKVFCFDRSKLLILNSYNCRQNPDRIYYLLYIWKQTICSEEKDELIINGNIKRKDELVRELKRFIPNVYVLLPKSEFNRSPLAQVEELSFDMQTLLLCE